MYPAQALVDDLYTWEDLPEELYAPFDDLTYTKVTPYTEGTLTIYYEAPPFAGEDQRIFIEHQPSDSIWNSGSLSTAGGPCLVPDTESPLIEDLFSDTYTITTPFSSGTVTRFALCNWAGEDGNGCPLQLLYGGFGSDPETEPAEGGLKWSVSFQKYEEPEGFPASCIVNYGRLKDGFQNSPVGTYNIVYATEGSEFATVS
jgi:hypothetical protein